MATSYAIFKPSSAITAVGTHYLKSTAAYSQWIEDATGTALTEKPTGAIETYSVPLAVIEPAKFTQRLRVQCREIQAEMERSRPSCLSPSHLASLGYNVELGEQDIKNLLIVSETINSNQAAFKVFTEAREKATGELISLIYPNFGYAEWVAATKDESPIDIETLTAFASSQVDAFLLSQPGLVTSV